MSDTFGPSSMTYVEWGGAAGDPSLRWWRQSLPVGNASIEQLHLPHGGVEVRWRRGEVPTVVGPTGSPSTETLVGGSDVVGARFAPGRWPDLSNCSVLDLVGEHVALTDLSGGHVAADVDDSPLVRGVALRRAIRGLFDGRSTNAPSVHAVELVCASHLSVRDVAERMHVSDRQLRRQVRAATGSTPRELRRLARFQRFVANVQDDVERATRRSLADHAQAAGYADQSHLTRACSSLAGRTPKSYLDQTHERCTDHHHCALRPARVRHGGSRPTPRTRRGGAQPAKFAAMRCWR